jgi:hypothetical protein
VKAGLLAAVSAAFMLVGGAEAATSGFTARVGGLPEVQRVGLSYRFAVTVQNNGGALRNFCLDFSDDHNSWLIKSLSVYTRDWDSDTFCVKSLRRGTSTFAFKMIPAKQGNHKLSVVIGTAKLYPTVNNAVITDDNALEWHSNFVLV